MKHDIKFNTLREEARAGKPRAQYELAQSHIKQREYAEAVYWLQRAAQQGFYQASQQLKDVIQNGLKRK